MDQVVFKSLWVLWLCVEWSISLIITEYGKVFIVYCLKFIQISCEKCALFHNKCVVCKLIHF